jgi:hypothetical protein
MPMTLRIVLEPNSTEPGAEEGFDYPDSSTVQEVLEDALAANDMDICVTAEEI